MQADWEIAVFDRFTLDTRRRVLLAAGQPVQLDAKAFDLLAYLISRRAAPVSVTEALAEVWPGRTVSAANVAVQLSELRAALKKAGAADRLIVTSPGPRYRFVGDVAFPECRPAPPPEAATGPKQDPEGEPEPAPPARARRRLGIVMIGPAILAAAVVGIFMFHHFRSQPSPDGEALSIMVLPFTNTSPDRSQDYLAVNIALDLMDDLAHLPGCVVIARESATAAESKAPGQSGNAPSAQYVVSGALTQEGSSFHVIAQMKDTATGAVSWSTTWTEQPSSLTNAREDIVRRIASRLHKTLDKLTGTRSLHDRPEDQTALNLFYHARYQVDLSDSMPSLKAAQSLLEQAVRKRPDFADAQAELAWVLLHKVTTNDDPDEDKDLADARLAIQTALDFSPENVMALAARARAFQADGDCGQAEMFAAKALAIEDGSLEARSVLAKCAMATARLDDAADQYQQMLRINPDGANNRLIYLPLGYIRLIDGQYLDAIHLLGEATDENERPDPYSGMAPLEQIALGVIAAYELTGDHSKAVAKMADYQNSWPGRSKWRVSAYFPKTWQRFPGLAKVLEAVHRAGMPDFADPAASISRDLTRCDDGDFAPTPGSLAGGRLIETTELIRRRRSDAVPLIIDVGRGAGVIDGAVWWNAGLTLQDAQDFAVTTADRMSRGSKDAPVVLAGDGSSGCASYRAAGALIAKGYRNVLWYRGGEEAWAAAGQPGRDDRS